MILSSHEGIWVSMFLKQFTVCHNCLADSIVQKVAHFTFYAVATVQTLSVS